MKCREAITHGGRFALLRTASFINPRLHRPRQRERDLESLVETIAMETVDDWPGSSVSVEIEESYRNMKEILVGFPDVVENAEEAYRRAGLQPSVVPIRGGTDGSRLSFMGLPTPNIFAGEHNFHSRFEWISVADMHKAVEVIIELCKVWEERAPAN